MILAVSFRPLKMCSFILFSHSLPPKLFLGVAGGLKSSRQVAVNLAPLGPQTPYLSYQQDPGVMLVGAPPGAAMAFVATKRAADGSLTFID